MKRSNRDLMRMARRWFLGGVAGALLAGGAAAEPVVYHSVADDGQRESMPPTIEHGGLRTLNLWIAEDNEFPNATNAGVICKTGNGDERCGWDITIEVETSAGQITFGDLTSTPQGTVASDPDPARLRFNGGDYTSGELMPTKLGELEINSSGDAEGAIVIRQLRVVDAGLALTTPVPFPGGAVIVNVPEPSLSFSLLLGSGWLVGMRRLGGRG